MITFYAAIGCYRVKTEAGKKSVYIQKLGKYHPISIPEFAIWSSLLWEVMTYDELKKAYSDIMCHQSNPVPDFDQMLNMLVKRRLVISGVGYTGVDALYRMLADAFVVPYRIAPPKKAWCILRLLAKGKLPVADVLTAARVRKPTAIEHKVLSLIEQTPLSTAELIRCFDRNITDVSTPEKVIAGIYTDSASTQKHIANEEFHSANANPVLEAVSNLYLGRQVILEIPC